MLVFAGLGAVTSAEGSVMAICLGLMVAFMLMQVWLQGHYWKLSLSYRSDVPPD
jgi:hypothetical protein